MYVENFDNSKVSNGFVSKSYSGRNSMMCVFSLCKNQYRFFWLDYEFIAKFISNDLLSRLTFMLNLFLNTMHSLQLVSLSETRHLF